MPPKTYPEWVEAHHQDWLREAEALGGLAFHTQYMEGWKIWDACVSACIHIMREEAYKARPPGHTTYSPVGAVQAQQAIHLPDPLP